MVDTTETQSGISEEFASSVLFNRDMIEEGYIIKGNRYTIYPSITYYRLRDYSLFPDMDGEAYIDHSYIKMLYWRAFACWKRQGALYCELCSRL